MTASKHNPGGRVPIKQEVYAGLLKCALHMASRLFWMGALAPRSKSRTVESPTSRGVTVAQHFLLTAKARTLSLGAIMRMADGEAHARFQAIRFADNGGAAFCPRCECTAVYTYAARRIWKCKDYGHQFSVTSGTIFASCKLPIRDYLAAIAIYVNAVKGISALQLGRDLNVQYKTAYVMAHKIREAVGSVQTGIQSGTVEVDDAYFGGHAKRENKKADRADTRLSVPAKRNTNPAKD
jgi:transposase-like protein